MLSICNFVLEQFFGESVHSLYQIHWVEKHESVLQFLTSLPQIVEALDSISEWSDIVTSSKALNFSKSLTCCKFIVPVHVISSIFSITSPINRLLKSKRLDKFSATNIIRNVYSQD